MKKKKCSICLCEVTNEDAPILTMGAYGIPRYLCDDCASLMEVATLGTDYEEIVSAMSELTSRMSDENIDDKAAMDTVTEAFREAAERATAIKNGTYDFTLDELTDEGVLEDIPEELRESEEDRALDEQEAEEAKRVDKFMNWVWLGVLIGAIAFIIWRCFF